MTDPNVLVVYQGQVVPVCQLPPPPAVAGFDVRDATKYGLQPTRGFTIDHCEAWPRFLGGQSFDPGTFEPFYTRHTLYTVVRIIGGTMIAERQSEQA